MDVLMCDVYILFYMCNVKSVISRRSILKDKVEWVLRKMKKRKDDHSMEIF